MEHVGYLSMKSFDFDLRVDTALSWDGIFPEPAEEDYIVQVENCGGSRKTILVSRRYLPAVDEYNAVEIAIDAAEERFRENFSLVRWVAGWNRISSENDHYWSKWNVINT